MSEFPLKKALSIDPIWECTKQKAPSWLGRFSTGNCARSLNITTQTTGINQTNVQMV